VDKLREQEFRYQSDRWV